MTTKIESIAPTRESMVSPVDLFHDEDLGSAAMPEDDVRWWVLHTRSRAEKALAKQLAQESVDYFLPLFERRKKLQRRIVRSYLPLFPGYLFLHCNDDGRRIALDTKLVANCIKVDDQSSVYRDLKRILTVIESGAQLSPEARLEPGMPARITKGSMAGLEGTVIQRKSGFRFVVAVDFLQQGAGVEVDDCMLEPI